LILSESQIEGEIDRWLKRHFIEQCNEYNGLKPFEGAFLNKVETPYVLCRDKTFQNCLNGYRKGKPFRRERVQVYFKVAYEYLMGLQYSNRQKVALTNLLHKAVEFNSLNMHFSYDELKIIFKARGRDTVSSWLKQFREDNVLGRLKKGSNFTGKASVYRLMLPADCYQVITD
jgi:hypothetical protein